MKPSPNIHKEISYCEKFIEQLAESKNLDDFERCWLQVLGSFERIWKKCESHYAKSPKWPRWNGEVSKVNKTDPLLQYLRNARGANEHGVEDITSRHQGGIGISAGSDKPLLIKQLVVGSGLITGEWDGDLKITFMPERVVLVSVTNFGKTYPVPSTHLGKKLPNSDALTLAKAALSYYKNLIKDADSFFADK